MLSERSLLIQVSEFYAQWLFKHTERTFFAESIDDQVSCFWVKE